MDNRVIFGYLKCALDGMYIFNDNPLTDIQRESLFNNILEAFDTLTEEEAKDYFYKYSNTNIKE